MSGEKIMIVDDDEDLQVLYSLYLKGESYEIVQALNGQEALDLLEKERPDLIVLDMIMPVMDGEEFFIKLRAEKKMSSIPVIIASINEKIPQRLFGLGIHDILRKPFTIDVLVDRIRKALNEKKG
ncbi:MAG: response regulator [Candidatus Omnitrophota bacterium]|jgi:CheY-like chemotaxis protein